MRPLSNARGHDIRNRRVDTVNNPPERMQNPSLDTLEPRTLLAWGAYPQLIDQDLATTNFPSVTGNGALIVVIDSGINAAHPNLSGHLWKNPDEIPGDGVDNDG